ERGAQRVAAVDVVGAVGGQHDEASGAQGAQQVGEQVPGGGVGPVQVLQGEDHGVLGGDAFEQPGGELEEARHAVFVAAGLAGGLGAEFGQQPGQFLLLALGGGREFAGQFAAQPAQGGGQGGEGQSVGAYLDTAAECHDGAPAPGRGGELLDEAGLADACLAGDQQRLRFARGGTGERVVQRAQFASAADEHGTDGPGLQCPEQRTHHRQRGTGFPHGGSRRPPPAGVFGRAARCRRGGGGGCRGAGGAGGGALCGGRAAGGGGRIRRA